MSVETGSGTERSGDLAWRPASLPGTRVFRVGLGLGGVGV